MRIIFLCFLLSSPLLAIDIGFKGFGNLTETIRKGEYPYHYDYNYGGGGGIAFHQKLTDIFTLELDTLFMYKKNTYVYICPIAHAALSKTDISHYYVHIPIKFWYMPFEFFGIAAGGFASYGVGKVHIYSWSLISGATLQDDKVNFADNGMRRFDYGVVLAARLTLSTDPHFYGEVELHYGLRNILLNGFDSMRMKTVLFGAGFGF